MAFIDRARQVWTDRELRKKILIVATLFLVFGFGVNTVQAASFTDRLAGRILLQVESKGESWWVHPKTKMGYYLGRPQDAFNLMRTQGIGISNEDIEKIRIGLHAGLEWYQGKDADGDGLPNSLEESLISANPFNNDSDGDGLNDRVEIENGYHPMLPRKFAIDTALVNRLKGNILLQVEQHGEAWYVNPVDGKRYFLGRPADAFAIMRNLGLGITNGDLEKIQTATDTSNWLTYRNSELSFEVRYPYGWEVLQNDPLGNRVNISLRDKEYDGSFEWPGFTVSETIAEFAGFHEGRKFRAEDQNDGVIRIGFDLDGKRLYAGCSLYLDRNVLDTCNQILLTLMLIK